MIEAAAVGEVEPPRRQVRDGTAAVARTPMGRAQRRGVRRTVTVLAVVIGIFYLLSFLQILLMK
ncbi:MAG: hypothetical protein EPN56_05315 [Rhodanobacter sp.]|nr:MAG: hypothetical protein EPN78_01500 [Rhodanobacter sp.]TAM15133.1 MAG: hypothetical protein EPN66_00870 [Rhodanobacter sp.]TAM36397.1 MAG: hypothetical protein EPN56_05315 [Rhodanobacter sp.]